MKVKINFVRPIIDNSIYNIIEIIKVNLKNNI